MSCNPCNTTLTNTIQNESLPSQISNFTAQFFGTVVKTEIDGAIQWVLPCGLDEGLPNNPRMEGEGLACFFRRLFMEGIVGLTGPQGEPGAAGANGNNSYTVTLQGFTQPDGGSPNIQVQTAYNPSIMEGTYIFIQDSGFYLVTATDTSGAVFATLIQAFPGAAASITAGKLVVLSGIPGASITGGDGPQGPVGPAGSNATSFSVDNGVYYAPVGTDANLQVTYSAIDFVNSSPVVTLPAVGTYRVTVTADLVGLAGVLTSDKAFLKLRNTSTAADVPGTEHAVSNFVDTACSQLTITAQVITTGASQSIALYGKCDTADKVAVVALRTTITYDRLG